MTLSREEILAAVDARATELTPHPVPEWGGDVLIRRLSVNEAEAAGLGNDGGANRIERVLSACLVDSDGKPLFTQKDVKALAKIDVGVAAGVFTKCVQVNGLSDESLDEAVAAFSEAQSGSSSTS